MAGTAEPAPVHRPAPIRERLARPKPSRRPIIGFRGQVPLQGPQPPILVLEVGFVARGRRWPLVGRPSEEARLIFLI